MGTNAQILFPDGSVAEAVADGYPENIGPKIHTWWPARDEPLEDINTLADDFVTLTEAGRKQEYPKEITLGRLIHEDGAPKVTPGKTTVIEYKPVFFSRDMRGRRLQPASDGQFNYTYTVTEDGRVFSGRELKEVSE